ncbi:MAG TPA: Xaa-Pro peptidase family protein [archaeon]|nr:Xaa-Pro peptidase family protein [archaeon]
MQKISRFQEALRKSKLDAAVILTDPNVTYFTGQRNLGSVVFVPADAKPVVFTNTLEKSRAQLSGFLSLSVGREGADVRTKSIFEAIKNYARGEKLKFKKIGMEKSSLTISQFARANKFLRAKTYEISSSITQQRALKEPEEIKLIRRAAAIADSAEKAVRESLRPGITEAELAAVAETEMRKAGAEWFSFETIVGSGPNSALPHHTTSSRKIKSTDLVVVDLGAIYKSYCSDTTRTFCLKPPLKEEKIFSIVAHAQKFAIEKINSGKAVEVDAATRAWIKKFGYNLIHGTGHGIGVEVHEVPYVGPNSKDKLRTGTVFTIEPGIYIPKFGGVRIEDMFLKTKNGFEILTKSDRSLVP